MAETAKKSEKKEEVGKTTTSGDVVKEIWDAFINTLSGMYKKPMTTLKEEVKNPNTRNNLIMLFAIALSFGLMMMTGFKSVISFTYNGLSIDDLVEVPYVKILCYATILYAAFAFIPILVSFVISRVMKDDNFDFKKSICLYTTSMSIIIPVNLLMAILYGLNIVIWLGTIIAAVVNVMCFLNYILGYINIINVKEDKQVGTLAALIISWVVVAFVVLCIIVGVSMPDTNTGGLHRGTSSYNDLLEW
ncbi:MAG: hypothetical protein K2L98_02340 [Bacilli bacterium]|nr:hypothetical protein [Bacilli bacterium]